MFSCLSSPDFTRKYDVFLSFRGRDVRKKFISHLHAALQRKMISTFKDDCGIAKGMDIESVIIEAIECSKISVVTFSENYAASRWCLDELVNIMKCKETKGQIVVPVFYEVTPREVRDQTGSFKSAFAKHENEFADMEIQKWRNAMKEVACLSGWSLSNARDEAEVVKQIVDFVSKRLNQSILSNIRKQIKKIVHRLSRKPDLSITSDLRSQVESLYDETQVHEVELGRRSEQLLSAPEIVSKETMKHKAGQTHEWLALWLKRRRDWLSEQQETSGILLMVHFDSPVLPTSLAVQNSMTGQHAKN